MILMILEVLLEKNFNLSLYYKHNNSIIMITKYFLKYNNRIFHCHINTLCCAENMIRFLLNNMLKLLMNEFFRSKFFVSIIFFFVMNGIDNINSSRQQKKIFQLQIVLCRFCQNDVQKFCLVWIFFKTNFLFCREM